MANLNTVDWTAVITYFIVVFIVGIWATFRPNKDTTEGYFLAGKSMAWIPVGASIFATNIGAPMFIGLAGDAAASGFAVTLFEWQAAFMLVLLGWIFMPVYTASNTMTMPEYLQKRYGGERLRLMYSIISIILLAIRNIPGEMYAGALFLKLIFNWDNIYLAVGVILITTAVYTIAGGLAAVIYTDTLQSVILVIGTMILVTTSMVDIGGLDGLYYHYPKAISNITLISNRTCGYPRDDWSHMFRDPIDSDWPWPGMTFGLTVIAGIWYMDQVYVQRVLAAKNISHAKGGALLAGYLKMLPFILFIIPGMISRIKHADVVACATKTECIAACNNEAGCTNMAYAYLVLYDLPQGVRGVMVAALLAALVSSLTSTFNSASTMFTLDLWTKIRKQASELEQGVVGRFFVLIMVTVSVAWIEVMQGSAGAKLWAYFQLIASSITPPWIAAFAFGVFWPRTTEQGAFWSLLSGEVLGIAWMILSFMNPAPLACEPDTRIELMKKVHYMNFAMILFLLCVVVIVTVSLLTEPLPPEKLRGVTFFTRHQAADHIQGKIDDLISKAAEAGEGGHVNVAYNAEDYDDKPNNIKGGETSDIPREKSFGMKIKEKLLEWMCGISDKPRPTVSEEQKLRHQLQNISLKENGTWKHVLDGAACLLLAIIIMLCIIFA